MKSGPSQSGPSQSNELSAKDGYSRAYTCMILRDRLRAKFNESLIQYLIHADDTRIQIRSEISVVVAVDDKTNNA